MKSRVTRRGRTRFRGREREAAQCAVAARHSMCRSPAAFRAVQSNAKPDGRPRRNTRTPARFDSSQSFADTAHEADFSDSSVRASTPRPISPQLAVPRRDSHEYLETIRKKTRKPIRITSAASYNREEPAVLNTPSGRRVSWASRAINCCALSARKKSPPVSIRVPTPLSDECTPTRCKQRTRDDRRAPCEERREPSIFTFDPCAIAAFARETAEREAHNAVTRDCASSRLHASRESIGGAFSEENSNVHAAHDSHAPRDAYKREFAASFKLFFAIELRRFFPSNPSLRPSTHASYIAFAAALEATADREPYLEPLDRTTLEYRAELASDPLRRCLRERDHSADGLSRRRCGTLAHVHSLSTSYIREFTQIVLRTRISNSTLYSYYSLALSRFLFVFDALECFLEFTLEFARFASAQLVLVRILVLLRFIEDSSCARLYFVTRMLDRLNTQRETHPSIFTLCDIEFHSMSP